MSRSNFTDHHKEKKIRKEWNSPYLDLHQVCRCMFFPPLSLGHRYSHPFISCSLSLCAKFAFGPTQTRTGVLMKRAFQFSALWLADLSVPGLVPFRIRSKEAFVSQYHIKQLSDLPAFGCQCRYLEYNTRSGSLSISARFYKYPSRAAIEITL